MNVNRIDEIARFIGTSDAAITGISRADVSIEEIIELCSLAKQRVVDESSQELMRLKQNDPNPQPEPKTDWMTLRTAFEEAARGLTKIARKDERARAIAALAILLNVDSEVAEILSER